MDWAILKPIILTVVAKLIPFWGGLAAKLLGQLLPDSGKLGDAFKAKEAPDSLKALVKEFLLNALDKLNRSVMKTFLKVIIERLDGAIMDAIWDQLFAAKQVETLSGQHVVQTLTHEDVLDIPTLEAEFKLEFATV